MSIQIAISSYCSCWLLGVFRALFEPNILSWSMKTLSLSVSLSPKPMFYERKDSIIGWLESVSWLSHFLCWLWFAVLHTANLSRLKISQVSVRIVYFNLMSWSFHLYVFRATHLFISNRVARGWGLKIAQTQLRNHEASTFFLGNKKYLGTALKESLTNLWKMPLLFIKNWKIVER